MKICCFFGHRDAPGTLRPLLRETVEHLILTKQADRFIVGDHGAFDRMVQGVLKESEERYGIDYNVMLTAFPVGKSADELPCHPLIPENLERIPPRFAIARVNRQIADMSDMGVTYVTRTFGGAWEAKERLRKAGKYIIELSGD